MTSKSKSVWNAIKKRVKSCHMRGTKIRMAMGMPTDRILGLSLGFFGAGKRMMPEIRYLQIKYKIPQMKMQDIMREATSKYATTWGTSYATQHHDKVNIGQKEADLMLPYIEKRCKQLDNTYKKNASTDGKRMKNFYDELKFERAQLERLYPHLIKIPGTTYYLRYRELGKNIK